MSRSNVACSVCFSSSCHECATTSKVFQLAMPSVRPGSSCNSVGPLLLASPGMLNYSVPAVVRKMSVGIVRKTLSGSDLTAMSDDGCSLGCEDRCDIVPVGDVGVCVCVP